MGEDRARQKVPVVAVAAEAYRGVFGQLGLVLELGWIPLLVLLAAAILPPLFLGPALLGTGDLGFGPADLIEAVVALFCLNAFAVRWHQIILYGRRRSVPRQLFPRAWGRFLFYTLLYLAVLTAVATALALGLASGALGPLSGQPRGVMALAIVTVGGLDLLVLLVSARLGLLFPASAYGHPLRWGAAWKLLGGNTWRLIACGFIACAPFLIIVQAILAAVLDRLPAGASMAPGDPSFGYVLLRGVLVTVVNVLVVALGASILSSFYRRLVLSPEHRRESIAENPSLD